MGRQPRFKREEALRTATIAFWTKGYRRTSMRTLAEQLGVHLGSIYNSLGDKEQLFELALKLHYRSEVLPHLLALQKAPDTLGAIEEMITAAAQEGSGGQPAPESFIINSLTEITQINDNVTRTVHSCLRQAEDILVACIAEAQKKGEIPAGSDPRQRGQFLHAMLLTIYTMRKLKVPPTVLASIRDCTLQVLAA